MAKALADAPAAIAKVAGAVVNNAAGAGTVTATVSCTPFASVTTTLAEPPLVLGSALMVHVVIAAGATGAVITAVTNAGLELTTK